MLQNFAIAMFLIAIPAISTDSVAQNVYKCGATYSQMPCEGSVPLSVGDRRSQEQQSQSAKVATQDAKTAAAMEKTRLKEEAKARVSGPGIQKIAQPTEPVTEKKQKSVPTTTILSGGAGSKNSASKNKESEYFTANAATDKKKNKGESPR